MVDEETQKNDLAIVRGWGRSNYIGQDLTLALLGNVQAIASAHYYELCGECHEEVLSEPV